MLNLVSYIHTVNLFTNFPWHFFNSTNTYYEKTFNLPCIIHPSSLQ